MDNLAIFHLHTRQMHGCVILVTLIKIADLVEVGKSNAKQGWHQDLAAEAVLVSVWCATVSLLCCPGTKVQMAEGQQQDDGAPVAFKLPWWQPPPPPPASHCAPLHRPPALLTHPGSGGRGW